MLPTWTAKHYSDGLSLAIAHVRISNSFIEAEVSFSLKRAAVEPLIKMKGLDKNAIRNYLSVTRLYCSSKITEKICSICIWSLSKLNSLFPTFQSVYIQCHITVQLVPKTSYFYYTSVLTGHFRLYWCSIKVTTLGFRKALSWIPYVIHCARHLLVKFSLRIIQLLP